MLELDVEKRLNGFALKVSLALGDELVAFFGPSGSGKTLTLRCIAGLVEPDSGRIVINGQVVLDTEKGIKVPPQSRKVGYVFQDYALLPHLSVADNIAFGLHRLPRKEREMRVQEMISLAGLGGLEKRRPGELSGGEQQRVAIARALALGPSILLLDEPFTALDSGLRRRLQEDMVQLLRPLGITTVLVTHNLREAYILSDKIAIFEGGRVLQVGSSQEVVSRPARAAVAKLVGIDNVLRGTVSSVSNEGLELECSGSRFMALFYPFPKGTSVDFCVPARDVVLIAPCHGSSVMEGENQLVGQVVSEISHLGNYVFLFKVDGWGDMPYHLHLEVPAHMYHDLYLEKGDRWIVGLRKEAIHVMPIEGALS